MDLEFGSSICSIISVVIKIYKMKGKICETKAWTKNGGKMTINPDLIESTRVNFLLYIYTYI